MHTGFDQRRALLTAALGFQQINWRDEPPASARALATWMNTWRAVGAVMDGMMRQGFEAVVSGHADGW